MVSGSKRSVVYGIYAVRALVARRPEAIVRASLLGRNSGERLTALKASIGALGVPIQRVGRGELDRLSLNGIHQGVVVETRAIREFTVGDFESLVLRLGKAFRGLLLDGVQDPRNLGACLRTADAAGVHAVVVPRRRSAKLTPAALKAATGAAETLPLVRVSNLASTVHWLKEAGVWILGAEVGAPKSLYSARLETPLAFVLGGESQGLRRLTRELCDELVSIPTRGTVESLNVSVAAGILLFEFARRFGDIESRDFGRA
ncbi:MAG: 23S rRNA (guanosine(2251)-2'-O)-methyltransferase RlmB [Gammaproteobacteria bacterium]